MAGSNETARGWRVTGQVQGVGFRWSTVRRARALGLAGWVRNESDGSVRVRARGDETGMRALEDWLRRGPSAAEVLDLEREPVDGGSEIPAGDFQIRHD